ncbi:Eukaryotic cytochrome b561 [Niabella soli DSM 19437]|uniref:Eukaryotic cytochrome b561 n=1 Tax=Niabella soli DSM 19437 TaxID=929713 RepID=W0EYB1_9BACT|nr:Eukaryotic cytochrome b561 [Niabella soli DSM 19437]
METGLLHLHSFLRWIILLLLVIAILRSIGAGNKPFTIGQRRIGSFLTIVVDIELLIGLIQWFTGPWGYKQLTSRPMAEIMADPVARFFTVEHITMMIIAVALIHIGKSAGKKNISDRKKHRKTALFYVLALIIILAAVPWPFRAVGAGRGWF